MQVTRPAAFALILAFFSLFLTHLAQAQQYTITDLGALGGLSSNASAVNASGQVIGSADVGQSPTGDPISHAFLYSGGILQDLGTLGGANSKALGLNSGGQVVGSSDRASGSPHAFLYGASGMADLGTLAGDSGYSIAYGINSALQVVGSTTAGDAKLHAFFYDHGTMTDLGLPDYGTNTQPLAINDSGQVTGKALGVAFLHMGSGPLVSADDLPLPPGATGSVGAAINAAGAVVGTALPTLNAYEWQGGTATPLGSLLDTMDGYSAAAGVNAQGQIVGGSIAPGAFFHGFLWQNGTMTDLNSLLPGGSGWVVTRANGINDRGWVVGVGTHTVNGIVYPRAFLMQPIIAGVTLVSLSPASAPAGAPALTLTLNGSGWTAGDQVQWNGQALTTTVVSPMVLTAQVSASLLASPGSASVTVSGPSLLNTPANGLTFIITPPGNPKPTLIRLSDSSAVAGSPGFTAIIYGSNFVSGATVTFGSDAGIVSTVQEGGHDLYFDIPAGDIATAGTLQVSVTNPPSADGGGGASNILPFTILAYANPSPQPVSLSPSSVTAGGPSFTLTVNGSYFLPGAHVSWKASGPSSTANTALTATYVSPTQLTALIPAELVISPQNVSVTISNPAPSAGESSALTFSVTPPVGSVPTLTALAPTQQTAGQGSFTLHVTGTGFVSGATVAFGADTGLLPVPGSLTLTGLDVLIPATDIATAGTVQVTVSNPSGGGPSNALPFTITPAPAPILSAFSPSSVIVGSPDLTLSVGGGNFTPSSQVQWNGTPLATTYGSANSLTALVPAALLATAGQASLTVVTPGPNGGVSNTGTFSVNNPAPHVDFAQPATITAGGPDQTLTLGGTGFVAGAQVQWGQTALATTFVSATRLTAVVPAALTASVSTAFVSVTNPAPGGGPSNTLTYSVVRPLPTLSVCSPVRVIAGSGSFTLHLTGTGFVPVTFGNPGARVTFGTDAGLAPLPGTETATSLDVVIPAADVATPASVLVTVTNTTTLGGSEGTSNPLAFSVIAPDTTAPTTTATATPAAPDGANGWYTGPVRVSLAATDPDDGAGAITTYETTDGTTPTASSPTYSGPIFLSADGVHTLQFFSKDLAGNAEAVQTLTVKIDGAPPTLTFGTPSPAPNAAGWNDTSVTIPLTAADATSGVASATPGGPLSFTQEGAKQTQTVTVTDRAGNSAQFISPPVSIDWTAPVTTAASSGARVSLSATDNLSGVSKTFDSVDGGSAQVYAAPFTVTGVGGHTVSYWSVDVAGNGEAHHALSLTVAPPPDTSAPTTTASLPAPNGTNGWHLGPVQVTLSATDPDGASDVAHTFYTLDGGPQQTYSPPLLVAGDGVHALTFWSVDRAGNTEKPSQPLTVKIDGTPPTLTFGAPSPAPNSAGWNNAPVSVPYSAADATSGVASAAPGSPLPFAAEGANQMQTVNVTDSAGNTGSFTNQSVNIDMTPPVTTGVASGAQVTLAATDALSGVAATTYQQDGGSPQTYTGPFTVTGAGPHTITFSSVDRAGNREAARALSLTVPPSGPAVLHTFPPGLQMLSAPEDFGGVALGAAFSAPPTRLIVWDPGGLQYLDAGALKLGAAFWARMAQSSLLYDRGVPTPTNRPFSIALLKGWNMVGDPFPADAPLSAAQVESGGQSRSVADAAQAGLLGATLYGYPAGAGQYQTQPTSGGHLSPYAGYWVYAGAACTLQISPPSGS